MDTQVFGREAEWVEIEATSICRTHFLSYLTWRRRKGPQMFMKYAGMTMEERDPLVAEWANTIRVEEAPTATAPKT